MVSLDSADVVRDVSTTAEETRGIPRKSEEYQSPKTSPKSNLDCKKSRAINHLAVHACKGSSPVDPAEIAAKLSLVRVPPGCRCATTVATTPVGWGRLGDVP